jgi:septum site-determining protein MinD
MVRKIGVISIKGGVGKTTVAASLAADLKNHFGKKVLLVDGNYSAPNLGLHMDVVNPEKTIHHVLDRRAKVKNAIHNRYGVDVIPGSYVYDKYVNVLKLKDKLKPIEKNYDFIIIDSSPSLNEEMLSTMLASDDLFLVTTPDWPTLSCSLNAAKIAKQRGKNVSGLIVNKVRDPYYELTLKEVEEATGIPVVARIPDDKSNTRAVFTRIPTSIYNRRCKFSKEINRLSSALTGEKEKLGLKKFLPKGFRREQINRQLLKESFYNKRFN